MSILDENGLEGEAQSRDAQLGRLMNKDIKRIIEGLLMAACEPLRVEDIAKVFDAKKISLENKEVKAALNDLIKDYEALERASMIKEVASGFRMQVKPDLSDWVDQLWEEKPPRYSRAFLETLALMAYKQPVTRAEIEEVRGVAVSSHIVKTLLEHGWVKVVGHKEVPGRPALFATTKKFLDYFNLKNLSELPPLRQLIDFDELENRLQLEMGEKAVSEELSSEDPK